MREWMKSLVEQVAVWPEASTSNHRFGGIEFREGKREIGYCPFLRHRGYSIHVKDS